MKILIVATTLSAFDRVSPLACNLNERGNVVKIFTTKEAETAWNGTQIGEVFRKEDGISRDTAEWSLAHYLDSGITGQVNAVLVVLEESGLNVGDILQVYGGAANRRGMKVIHLRPEEVEDPPETRPDLVLHELSDDALTKIGELVSPSASP